MHIETTNDLNALISFQKHPCFARPYKNEESTIQIAKIGEVIIAVAICVHNPKGLTELKDRKVSRLLTIIVDESHQNEGIGTKLMLAISREVKKRGNDFLYVEVPVKRKFSEEELADIEELNPEEKKSLLAERKTAFSFFIKLNITECMPLSLLEPVEVNRKRYSRVVFDIRKIV